MKHLIFDRHHIREYTLYGIMAAIAYVIPVFVFLQFKSYSKLFFFYIGTALFMTVIFIYVEQRLLRRYDPSQKAPLLAAGTLATFTGVLVSELLLVLAFVVSYPHFLSTEPPDQILQGTAPALKPHSAAGLMGKMMMITLISNIPAGIFITLISGFARKQEAAES